ncbi:hypothetical protein C1646_778238 [Rhizophagus diaphanus]|nr:hypothetical protein C1646_778238 [Rhizophagus diaphanus] [Rhizophagus sp. MUCL 43196]
MDSFLLEAHKKIVSSEIKQRNKERQADRKKLSKAEQASLNQDQESDTGCSTSEKIPPVSNPVTKISTGAPGQNSHRKKGAENIVQLIVDGIKDDARSSDKPIPYNVISIESLNQNSSTDSLLSLAQLFDKADDAEYGAICANQEEILRWKTQKAVKIYKLFEKFKISDNFSKHNDNDNSDVEEESSHMTEISAGGPSPNHVTENSETSERIINTPPALESSEVNTSANILSSPQSKPTYNQPYFRNKILGQYPNLYRECSIENFDYYGITDETTCGDYICPLCKLGHDDKEIEGRYKAGSYFIKCEQREIEIVA